MVRPFAASLAASAASYSLGIDLNTISKGVSGLETVPGRLELIKNKRGLSIIVDYAHTPDALLKAQRTLPAVP